MADHNIRKLTRMGGGRSIGVTLPIEMVKELKWREKPFGELRTGKK